MGRGKRYEEPKLNMKKVFAVLVAFIVLIMFIFIIKGVFTRDKKQTKITSEDYFSVFKDNKWGVINSKGEIVIDPSYEEMVTVPDSKKDVFLCIYDVNYDTGEYKTKALNSKNEEIFTNYEQIETIQNNDASDNVWIESNVLKVKKDGKYGIINLAGKELTTCKYEEITAIQGIKNAIKVKENGKYGVIDNEGNQIVEPKYADVDCLGTDNKSGYIVKSEDGKYGIVDYSRGVVIDLKYESISKVYGNNMYVVKENGKEILIKKDGTTVLENGYDTIKGISKNGENIIIMKDGKYGEISINGDKVIEPQYEDLKEAKTGILVVCKDGKYGIIDIQNQIKTELKYSKIDYDEKADIYIAEKTDFSNDIIDETFTVKVSGILTDINDEKGYLKIKQGDEYKYYNFKFEEKTDKDINPNNTLFLSKKDGKYGFVDKNGNVVVDYIYDDATEQNSYGFAGIKKDGKWGSINDKGEVTQEPTYNLDDYLKIDFVGRWHYGKDINMNYYNQL